MNPCDQNGHSRPSSGFREKVTSILCYTFIWTGLIAGIVAMSRCALS